MSVKQDQLFLGYTYRWTVPGIQTKLLVLTSKNENMWIHEDLTVK